MYKLMKIYYDKTTGDRIWDVSYNQDTVVNFDHDYETVIDLNSRVKDSIGLLVLENGEYEQDFAEGRLIGVDLEKKIPLFAYPNPEDPGQELTPLVPLSEEVIRLTNENKAQDQVIEELMFVIIPELSGGGI